MHHDADPVSLLLAKWEELREAGREVSPEELCGDDAELLEKVRQKIDAIRAMDERFPEKDPLDPEETKSQVTDSFEKDIESLDGDPAESGADRAESAGRQPTANRVVLPWLIAGVCFVSVLIVAWQWQSSSRKVEALQRKLETKPAKTPHQPRNPAKQTTPVDVEPDLSAPRYQRSIADHWSNLGRMLMDDKRFADAAICFQRALISQEKLAKEAPSESLLVKRVGTLHFLGFVYSKSNKLEKAEQTYRRAGNIQRQLAADYPKNPDYTSQHGVGLNNLALLVIKSRPDEARKLLQEAADCQYRALKLRPGGKNYCLILRQILLALKSLHNRQGDRQALKEVEAKLSNSHAGCW